MSQRAGDADLVAVGVVDDVVGPLAGASARGSPYCGGEFVELFRTDDGAARKGDGGAAQGGDAGRVSDGDFDRGVAGALPDLGVESGAVAVGEEPCDIAGEQGERESGEWPPVLVDCGDCAVDLRVRELFGEFEESRREKRECRCDDSERRPRPVRADGGLPAWPVRAWGLSEPKRSTRMSLSGSCWLLLTRLLLSLESSPRRSSRGGVWGALSQSVRSNLNPPVDNFFPGCVVAACVTCPIGDSGAR